MDDDLLYKKFLYCTTTELQNQALAPKQDELSFLNQDNNSIRRRPQMLSESGFQHNLSADQLFGSHYDSEKDEDYSLKEDLIQNTKTYKDDRKPIQLNISKAEVKYLLEQQNNMNEDSRLLLQLDENSADNYVVAITRKRAK